MSKCLNGVWMSISECQSECQCVNIRMLMSDQLHRGALTLICVAWLCLRIVCWLICYMRSSVGRIQIWSTFRMRRLFRWFEDFVGSKYRDLRAFGLRETMLSWSRYSLVNVNIGRKFGSIGILSHFFFENWYSMNELSFKPAQLQKLLQCCREPCQKIPLVITIQKKYSLTYLRDLPTTYRFVAIEGTVKGQFFGSIGVKQVKMIQFCWQWSQNVHLVNTIQI